LSGNGLTACVVMGRIAGKNAGRDAYQTLGKLTASSGASSANSLPPADDLPAHRLDTAMRVALITTMRDAAGKGLGIIRNQSGIARAERVFANIVKKFAPPYPLHPADQDILQMGILGELMCVAAAQRPESRGVQWRDDATTRDQNWKKWQIVTQSADGGYSWRERVMR
jgi:succinate dehydrogenase/fumarate reductase flavoprotein subunit